MSLVIAWLLFPAVLGLICAGHGLLVDRLAGGRLPGVLVVPVGLAALIVVSQLTTYRGATAPATTPLVVVIAIAGLAVGLPRLRTLPGGLDRWALAAAAAVFAVFAAPVVLTGQATFAGYTLLGDTAIHFVLIDWVMHHGRALGELDSLAPSSYRAALSSYLASAYPLGAHTALGSVRPLVGQDVAWVYQPFLAWIALATALSLYGLAALVVPQRWLRALLAFLAAQPGLVYAYALQGSIKELGTAWLVVLLAALLPTALGAGSAGRDWRTALRAPDGLRRLLPLAVTTAAAVAVISISALPWLGPLMLAAVLAVIAERGARAWRATGLDAVAYLALVAVLALPTLVLVRTFTKTTKVTITTGTEFGNLLGPLSDWQAFGIWPRGDYRLPLLSGDVGATYALIGVVIAGLVLGIVWCVRRRGWVPLVFFAVSLVAWVYVTGKGSPWSDGKALMIASPAVILAAGLGVAALWNERRRVEGVLLAGAILAGVGWTNALAYHDADLAPRGRLAELASVGNRIAGQGLTLYPEFEEFNKHFLRRGAPTGSTESVQDIPPAARPGAAVRFGFSSDLDALELPYVERFRTLVLRRSPSESRPPANYRRTWRGRWYEIWQRTPESGGTVLAHLPAGDPIQPAARPSCSRLGRLARSAEAGDRLAYVARTPMPEWVAARRPLPRNWSVDGGDPLSIRPIGPGRIDGTLRVARAGRYLVWLQGSFGRRDRISLDGRVVGAVSPELSPRGGFQLLGEVTLAAGRHRVSLVRPGGSLRPGNGGGNRLIGPLVLEPPADVPGTLREVPLADWRSLCARPVDWVELLRS